VLATQVGDYQGTILTQGGDAWRFSISSQITASDLYKWKQILIPIPTTEVGKNYVWSKVTDVSLEGTNNAGKTIWIDNMMIVSMDAPAIVGLPTLKDNSGNVVSNDMSYVNANAKTIELQFNSETSRIDTTTLTASNIKVQTPGGASVIPYTGAFDVAQGIYTLTLQNSLAYDKDYEVAISGVKNVNGVELIKTTSFKTSPALRVKSKKIVDSTDKVIDVSKALTSAKAVVELENGSADLKKATAILALYQNGMLLRSVDGKAIDISSSSGTKTINIVMSNLGDIKLSDGYSIVLYVWDDYQTMLPIIPKFPLQ